MCGLIMVGGILDDGSVVVCFVFVGDAMKLAIIKNVAIANCFDWQLLILIYIEGIKGLEVEFSVYVRMVCLLG